jgi:hypothetical protein
VPTHALACLQPPSTLFARLALMSYISAGTMETVVRQVIHASFQNRSDVPAPTEIDTEACKWILFGFMISKTCKFKQNTNTHKL